MPPLKLSVALCTYNGAVFIRQQLESIFSQILPVDEIVVCDDGSTDTTISIVKQCAEQFPGKIQIYRNPETLRVTKNFEKALSLCTGDIIFLSDQDDIWEFEKVKKIRDFFELHPGKNVVFTNASLFENGQKLKETAWDKRDFTGVLKTKLLDPSEMLKQILLNWNIATGATMAVRRSALANYLPFPFFKDYLHDHMMAVMAAAENKLGFIDECLITYRLHEHQQIGFRKRVVPFYLFPFYRVLQILKMAALKRRRIKQKRIIAASLQKFAVDFPAGMQVLKSV